jgi:hypothetical protein
VFIKRIINGLSTIIARQQKFKDPVNDCIAFSFVLDFDNNL